MSTLQYKDVAEDLTTVQAMVRNNEWEKVIGLLPWRRLEVYFEHVRAGRLHGDPNNVARLVNLRAYAELTRPGPIPDEGTDLLRRMAQSDHEFSGPWPMVLKVRLAQAYMRFPQQWDGAAEERFGASLHLADELNRPLDYAAISLIAGAALADTNRAMAEQLLKSAVRIFRSAVNSNKSYRPQQAEQARPFYNLARLWLASVHHHHGRHIRASWHAQQLKRLKRLDGKWKIEFGNELQTPIPYVEPFGAQ